MNFRFFIQLSALIFLLLTSIYPQGIAEPLSAGTFELGYSHNWYKREFHRDSPSTGSTDLWSNGTIYVRMGLYDVLTLSAEGMVWPVSATSNYPGESYLNYTFGVALSSPIIKVMLFELFLHMHYRDNLYLDRSNLKHDKHFRAFEIGIPLRYDFLKNYTIWLAPVSIWNDSVYLEEQTYSQSKNAVGISAGVDALFSEHLYINLSFTYAEYIIPNIIAGYRF